MHAPDEQAGYGFDVLRLVKKIAAASDGLHLTNLHLSVGEHLDCILNCDVDVRSKKQSYSRVIYNLNQGVQMDAETRASIFLTNLEEDLLAT